MTAPRLLVLANHQHAGIATALRALLPEAPIFSADTALLARDEAARSAAIATLATADHIVSQDLPVDMGPLSTAALRGAQRRLHLLPSFRFAGFHPDGITIRLDGTRLAGATGATHSRIAAIAYLAGCDERETAALFNSLVFARLGYFAAFATERARLLRQFAAYGFDLSPLFAGWLKPGCFMFAATHPRMRVLLDIGRLLCTRMGETPAPDAGEAAEDVADPLAAYPTHPLFPEIAGRIGVSPEGMFRGRSAGGAKPPLYSLESFIRTSFSAYRRVPLSALRLSDGVQAGLAALGLSEADFGRAAATRQAEAAPPQEAVFITWCGHLLGVETATSLLVQAPFVSGQAERDVADIVPAAVRTALPLAAPVQTTLAGGTLIAPGPTPGTITMMQEGRLLAAQTGRLTARFTADMQSDSELFLALPRGSLAILSDLMAADWTIEGEAAPVPGAAISLRPGFALALGPHIIDLTCAGLERTQAGNDLRITTANGTLVLQRQPEPPADARAIDPAASPPPLPAAASIEQFQLEPGYRLQFLPQPEMLHLPLTADLATRTWMYASHEGGGAPLLGRVALQATPMRATQADVLLSRGAEGIVLGPDSAWANGAWLNGAKLPPGLTQAWDRLLLRRDIAAAAPVIAGPACVFYTPALAERPGFLMQAALALHVLLPVLPTGTRLLLPASLPALGAEAGFDPIALLAALGFGGLPTLYVDAPLVRAEDLTWLSHGPVGAMPAWLLQSFRTRVHTLHPTPAPTRRLFIGQRHGPALVPDEAMEKILSTREFETVYPDDLTAVQQIDLFAAAAFIVAPHGPALANLLFCQPGTRVLELTPDTAFRPAYWQMSEKLGLFHAVLACKTKEGTEGGDLVVDGEMFRTLFRMLRVMDP